MQNLISNKAPRDPVISYIDTELENREGAIGNVLTNYSLNQVLKYEYSVLATSRYSLLYS